MQELLAEDGENAQEKMMQWKKAVEKAEAKLTETLNRIKSALDKLD